MTLQKSKDLAQEGLKFLTVDAPERCNAQHCLELRSPQLMIASHPTVGVSATNLTPYFLPGGIHLAKYQRGTNCQTVLYKLGDLLLRGELLASLTAGPVGYQPQRDQSLEFARCSSQAMLS